MDELDNILSNIDLEEEKQDAKGDYADEWFWYYGESTQVDME